jgi:hypothetical protein
MKTDGGKNKMTPSQSEFERGVMNAICKNLREHGGNKTHAEVWTSSLFPERLTADILRLARTHIKYESS